MDEQAKRRVVLGVRENRDFVPCCCDDPVRRCQFAYDNTLDSVSIVTRCPRDAESRKEGFEGLEHIWRKYVTYKCYGV